MKVDPLTTEQQDKLDELDSIIEGLRDLKNKLGQYKLDQVYILERLDPFNPKASYVDKTYTGFPVKYKVVYISKTGIPVLRRISIAGNPTGDCIIPPEALALQALNSVTKNETLLNGTPSLARLVSDPEQLDSILLQEDFDPVEQHRKKSQLFNEINKHNKSIAVRTSNNYNNIANFFKSKKPGDKFWTSIDKQFVIQSVTKVNREYVISCIDNNSQIVNFAFKDFMYSRLYSAQPRSFKKESGNEQ